MYSVVPYFFVKTVIEVPATFVQAFIMVVITYFMMGLQGQLMLLVVALWLLAVTSASMALMLGCFASDVKKALEVSPLLFVPQMLFAGFFVKISQVGDPFPHLNPPRRFPRPCAGCSTSSP